MRIGLGLAVAFEAGVGFLPLFGAPGYESALASGLLLPSVVAVASAAELGAHPVEPFEAYCRGVANGAVIFLAVLAVSLAHAARAGFCDPASGLLVFALGPGVGMLLAGAWSAVAAEFTRGLSRGWIRGPARVALALLLPIGGIGIGLARFLGSPMVFAFDPCVGFFSGTLYDTVLDFTPLVTYRAGTAATLFAGFVLALHLTHDEGGRLRFQGIGRPGMLLAGVFALVLSLAHTFSGPRLGHWHTRTTIAQALGAAVHGERCELIHARAIDPDEAQRVARECEAHVAEVEAWLGASGPRRITVFLFESADQKRVLMGAADTNIAKPWRAEVYIQGTTFPHRVLGHEIAHAVAGSVARGPFRVAGSFGGWLPDPGLIEGLAVAASPKEEDLSAPEWARAMKDLGVLPPLSRLFALGFLAESSSTAYTASGAFVEWVRARHGAPAIVAWYGGTPLPQVTGATWAELEAAWHASLDELPLPPGAREQAEARFKRPGFFARRCPRFVDGCRERADQLAGRGDRTGALLELERAAEVDPEDPTLRLELAEALVRSGQRERLVPALDAIIDDQEVPRQVRDRALEARADRWLADGEIEAARTAYREVLGRTLDEGRARTIEVKLAAVERPALRPAIVALLVGEDGRPDRGLAATLLGALSVQEPGDGLVPYLLARQRYDAGDLERAGALLDTSLARAIDVPRVRAEALRLRLLTACASGDAAGAAERLASLRAEPGVRPARLTSLGRLVERCRSGAAAAPAPPRTE